MLLILPALAGKVHGCEAATTTYSLFVNLKLFVVMGVTWNVCIDALCQTSTTLWYLVIMFNTLPVLFIAAYAEKKRNGGNVRVLMFTYVYIHSCIGNYIIHLMQIMNYYVLAQVSATPYGVKL